MLRQTTTLRGAVQEKDENGFNVKMKKNHSEPSLDNTVNTPTRAR